DGGQAVVGDGVMVNVDVYNNGPHETDVHFGIDTRTLPPGPGEGVDENYWYEPLHGSGWSQPDGADCDYRSNETFSCNVHLGPSNTFSMTMWFSAHAPGEFTLPAWVTGSLPDPNPADNQVTRSGEVLCSINGTEATDVLVGTAKRDSICGWGGSDVLEAVGARDKIFGGLGDDTFSSDTGYKQEFFGGPGSDTMDYASAQEPVSATNLTVGGGAGFDVYRDAEVIIGSRFADSFTGAGGSERILAGAGADRITDKGRRDVLKGQRGRDIIRAADGRSDTVMGGRGADVGKVDTFDSVTSVEITR
ncbi:MAG: hypothetical protein M3198_19815, partial [Actinomycetota bacterium]|nr:hypothetical protein [Actinomycetota bacterium]